MIDALISTNASGLLLAFLVISVSWLWEDAAAIAGALLAVDGRMEIWLAVTAVFIGICSGDLALYYLGRLSIRWRSLRGRLLLNDRFRAIKKMFRRKTILNILLIRFVPGLRTLGFILCGLWQVPAGRFIFSMTFAGVVWIGLVFTSVYKIGTMEYFVNSHWKWSLMLVALIMLIVNNLIVHFRFNRSKTKLRNTV